MYLYQYDGYMLWQRQDFTLLNKSWLAYLALLLPLFQRVARLGQEVEILLHFFNTTKYSQVLLSWNFWDVIHWGVCHNWCTICDNFYPFVYVTFEIKCLYCSGCHNSDSYCATKGQSSPMFIPEDMGVIAWLHSHDPTTCCKSHSVGHAMKKKSLFALASVRVMVKHAHTNKVKKNVLVRLQVNFKHAKNILFIAWT